MENYSQEFMVGLRKEPSVSRVDKPTRPAKARMLGYKAGKGFVVVRVKIKKGGRKKRQVHQGRRPSKSGMRGFSTSKSLQLIAEERANKKFPNLEVLNSYYLTDDGKQKWFEVLMQEMNVKGRVYRGLTSAGRRVRGLLHKGKKSA